MNTKHTILTLLAVVAAVSLLSAQNPGLDFLVDTFQPNHLRQGGLSSLRSGTTTYMLDSVRGKQNSYFKYDEKGRVTQIIAETAVDVPYKEDFRYVDKPDYRAITSFSSSYSVPDQGWIIDRSSEEGYVISERKLTYKSWTKGSTAGVLIPGYPATEEVFYPNGMRKSYTRLKWGVTAQQFIPETKVETELDSAYRIVRENYYLWVNEFILDWYSQYKYNQQNQRSAVLKFISKWDGTGFSWLNTDSTSYSYSEDGKEETATLYQWYKTTQSWIPITQTIINRDEWGHEINNLTQYWDSRYGSWINNTLTAAIFDSAGRHLKTERSNWNTKTNTWTPSTMSVNGWDSLGRRTLDEYFTWNVNLRAWTGSYRYQSEYDSLGQSVLLRTFKWDVGTASWKNETILETFWQYLSEPVEVLRYDAAPVKTLIPGRLPWLGLTTQRRYWNWNVSEERWVVGPTYTYYYSSQLTTPIQTVSSGVALNVYPNPAAELLTVEMDGIDAPVATGILTDLNGRQILRFTLKGQTQLDLSDLPAGLYILQVNAPGYQTMARKVIKGSVNR